SLRKLSKSRGLVYITIVPSALYSHWSFGLSQYNSTPLPSGSLRYNASDTPWSLAPVIGYWARRKRSKIAARSFLVGYTTAVWYKPTLLTGAGGKSLLCQVFKPI